LRGTPDLEVAEFFPCPGGAWRSFFLSNPPFTAVADGKVRGSPLLETFMKAVGLLLLCAGFAIVLTAFALLSTGAPRGGFVVAGIAVQTLGLMLTFYAHRTGDEE
jgi:hypothetical protein